MPPVTPEMLYARKEKDCVGITTERKYYRVNNTWIKRSLRPSEWQLGPNGVYVVPRFGMERVLNEGASLEFVAEKTNIPVPKLYACFEDDQAAYLIMEYVEGVQMAELDVADRAVVEKELEEHLKTLGKLKSSSWGGPSGIVVPPYRVMVNTFRPHWKMKPRETHDLVFCHNDLSTYNVIVDPDTLKVKAILDWEYAGFYPEEFGGKFYTRRGASIALKGEPNDEDHLVAIMEENEDKSRWFVAANNIKSV